MKWSEAASEILANALVVGSWHVTADTLPEIGRLIEAGMIRADDAYEGPLLFPTEKGAATALRRKLVVRGDEHRDYHHA